MQLKLRSGEAVILHMNGSIICLRREPKSHVSGATRLLNPLTEPRLISIDYGEALSFQALKNFSLGARYGVDAIEMRKVSRGGIKTDSNIRFCHITQICNVARLPGAHFNHRELVLPVKPCQCQRHTQLVILIPQSGVNRSGHRYRRRH